MSARERAGAGSAEAPSEAPAARARIEVGGRRLELTNLDRVLWPEAGFTKGQMIDYYRRVGAALVPHLAGRPLTLGRFPGGVDGAGFAQTECRGRPDWLATEAVRLRSGALRRYCVVNDLASLLWVANLGTVELHPFLARGDRPDEPTAVVFDLDPVLPADLLEAARAALDLREALAADGLVSLAKTSGSRGVHVHVPLNAGDGFPAAKAFARAVAGCLAADHPERLSGAPRAGDRAGTVVIDWARNNPRSSLAAAYSLRATPYPVASTPVAWEEVERAVDQRRPELLTFLAEDVLDRLERLGDLFRPVLELSQPLPG